MANTRSFGNIPDVYDARDIPLYNSDHVEEAHRVSRQMVSSSAGPITLKTPLPPVFDQGDIGSCTANAAAAALRFAYVKRLGGKYEAFEPSRLFMYFCARTRNEPRPKDVEWNTAQYRAEHNMGSALRLTISGVNNVGVCKEQLWPYESKNLVIGEKDVHKFEPFMTVDSKGKPMVPNAIAPKDYGAAWYQAKDYLPRAISFYRILEPGVQVQENATQTDRLLARDVMASPSIAMLEKCITDDYPFVFACQLYSGASLMDKEWEDDDGKTQGPQINPDGVFVPPPKDLSNVKRTDGHAMLAVGFNASKQLFLVQNSWGTNWPESMPEKKRTGRFWMPYAWFDSKQKHTYDFWVIKCGDAKIKPKVVFNPAHWNWKNLEG
jgi:hypothetical protein